MVTPTSPVLPEHLGGGGGGGVLCHYTSLPGHVAIILLSPASNFALNKQSGFLFSGLFS